MMTPDNYYSGCLIMTSATTTFLYYQLLLYVFLDNVSYSDEAWFHFSGYITAKIDFEGIRILAFIKIEFSKYWHLVRNFMMTCSWAHKTLTAGCHQKLLEM